MNEEVTMSSPLERPVGRLAPIERDESFDRTYIPMPGGWEVQTKGKGSSFRLYDAKMDLRMPFCDQPFLFDMIERMAKATHAEVTRLESEIDRLQKMLNEPPNTYSIAERTVPSV